MRKGRASRRTYSPQGARPRPRSVQRGLKSGLRRLNESGESLWLPHGEIGQNLAVDLNTGLVEPVDKSGIGQPSFAGRGINPLDPQRAESPLLTAAVAILILAGLFDRLNRNPKDVLA